MYKETIEQSLEILMRDTNLCIYAISPKKKASEYDQEIPQSHTADQPTAP